MEESLLQATTLVALPFLVVIVAEIDDVFARNVGRTAGRCEHLALHYALDFARDLDEKFFPDAPWARVLVGFFQKIVGGLAVNPAAY